jgi:hypothetical protein
VIGTTKHAPPCDLNPRNAPYRVAYLFHAACAPAAEEKSPKLDEVAFTHKCWSRRSDFCQNSARAALLAADSSHLSSFKLTAHRTYRGNEAWLFFKCLND